MDNSYLAKLEIISKGIKNSVSTDEAQKTINLRRNAVFRLAENVLVDYSLDRKSY